MSLTPRILGAFSFVGRASGEQITAIRNRPQGSWFLIAVCCYLLSLVRYALEAG